MKHKKSSALPTLLLVLGLVNIVLVFVLEFLLYKHNILPVKYRILFMIVALVIPLICLGLGLYPGSQKRHLTALLVLAIWLIICIVIFAYVAKTIQTLEAISKTDDEVSDSGSTSEEVPGQMEQKPEFKDGFIVYVSGIDQYGALEKVSRSDVNLVIAVDPVNKNMAMVSVPRDSYLPIADGGHDQMDKLTHAGNYGVQSSIHTIENALGIDISYYVRMNFSSFVKIIDAIGGVDVDNEQDFTAINGMHFEKGKIHLDSKQALMYVRERKHLPEGDFGRQKHQEMVVEAAFHKVMSPQIITSFPAIMDAISDSIETNASTQFIMDFVNSQIESADEWSFATSLIEGDSKSGLPSYAMPRAKLYFYVPRQESLQKNGELLNKVVQGYYHDVKKELEEEKAGSSAGQASEVIN